MKKKLIGIIALIGILSICSGCNKETTKETKPAETKSETKMVISYNELNDMEKVASLVFEVEKESLETKDIDDEHKINIASRLANSNKYGNYTEVTGTEMTNAFKKYFGADQTLNFVGIKCGADHGSEEANTMLIFDTNQDKYVYNDQHPGHGGGGSYYGMQPVFDSVEKEVDTYELNVKALFYGEAFAGDTGSTNYGSAYKSYSDAKAGQNALVTINDNDTYLMKEYEVPTYNIEKVAQDYKDKLDTYTFTFVKEGDNLIFKSYKKKA